MMTICGMQLSPGIAWKAITLSAIGLLATLHAEDATVEALKAGIEGALAHQHGRN